MIRFQRRAGVFRDTLLRILDALCGSGIMFIFCKKRDVG